MDIIIYFIDFFIHLDKYLPVNIQGFGIRAYVIIFLVIFCETGLTVTPALPGDSLLFALGAFAAIHFMFCSNPSERITECTNLSTPFLIP